MRWLQCPSTSFSVRPFAWRNVLPAGVCFAVVTSAFGDDTAQLGEALLHLFRSRRCNRLCGLRLHLLQDEIAVDETLQCSLRRVACAVDAEWLQNSVAHLFCHIALQDNAAVNDGDYVIEDHSPLGHWRGWYGGNGRYGVSRRCGSALLAPRGWAHHRPRQKESRHQKPLLANARNLLRSTGFPVKLVGADEVHAAFLIESRTRDRVQRIVQEFRVIIRSSARC